MDFQMGKGNITFTVLRKRTKNDLDTGPRNQTMWQCLPTINSRMVETFLAGLKRKFTDLLDKSTKK